MARNRKKYAYITVALPLDSPFYRNLLEDVQKYGKDLSVIAAMRIGNYYEVSQAGVPIVAPLPPFKEENIHPISIALSNAAEADEAWPDD